MGTERTGASHEAGVIELIRDSSVAAKALLAGIFVNRFGGFLQIFLVLFMSTHGYSNVRAGFALGAYGAGSVLGVLTGGVLADQLGARRTVLISTVGSTVPLLAVYYVHNYPALLAAVILAGGISQMFRPAVAALLSALTPADQQVMMAAMFRFALNLGTTAAPLIGALLMLRSYALLFWGEALAALAYAVIAALALPRNLTVDADRDAEQSDLDGGRGYATMLGDRRFLCYLLAMLINCTVYIQYLGTLPLAMRAAGYSTGWYAVMVAVNGLMVISCELFVTKFLQRRPARAVASIGLLLLGGGYAVYAIPAGLGIFLIGTIVWSAAEIIGGPTIFAYPAIAAPPGQRGRYLGAAHAMFGLGSAVGPAVGVALWSTLHRWAWLCCGGLALLGVGAMWFGVRPAVASLPESAAAGSDEPVAGADAVLGDRRSAQQPSGSVDAELLT